MSGRAPETPYGASIEGRAGGWRKKTPDDLERACPFRANMETTAHVTSTESLTRFLPSPMRMTSLPHDDDLALRRCDLRSRGRVAGTVVACHTAEVYDTFALGLDLG